MNLDDLRAEVDRLDGDLVALLNRRAACTRQIGEAKRRDRLPVADSRRESQVQERVAALNRGPLSPEALRDIYRGIIDACRNLQEQEESAGR